jgi:DnaK suppressor protein
VRAALHQAELCDGAPVDCSEAQEPRRKPMPEHNDALSSEFIGAQRQRLEALRERLLGAEGRSLAEERSSHEEHADDPGDLGDKAQEMPAREVHQALHDAEARRLNDIDRALQKIAEGTYGLSDASGQPIPRQRLEATPEAVLTVEEAGRGGGAIRS